MTTAIEINCTTGEVLERELTADELAQREADAKAYTDEQAKEAADKAAKAVEKAALLAKLGITADEAALLLG
jgi:hypothetical protein